MEFKILRQRAEEEIKNCQDLKELDKVYRKYLGKNGELTLIFKSMKDLSGEERTIFGKEANEFKQFLLQALQEKEAGFKNVAQAAKSGWVDVTAPGKKPEIGHLHPLTLVRRQVQEIFQQMGFSVVLGREVETEWYNFDALNIPPAHPARDMWNTLWLKDQAQQKKDKSQKLLLRTHTSPVQIRYMEKNNPPLRIIAPGRVFRREATDASHEVNFYQIEGLMVDKTVSVANFKAIIEEFFQRFFAPPPIKLPGGGRIKPISIRLRPSYFPFVEPGFEVDVSCTSCAGKGCSLCSQTGWLEMMGAGMVHPKVFEAVRLNPRDWQGFAFGMGLDRLAMMKYRINDIRLLYSGDLRFLNQF